MVFAPGLAGARMIIEGPGIVRMASTLAAEAGLQRHLGRLAWRADAVDAEDPVARRASRRCGGLWEAGH